MTKSRPVSGPQTDYGASIRELGPGQRLFGRYTLERMLGAGGMGVVWLAEDEQLGRDVALKFLIESLVHDKAAIDNLKRETRKCLELTHHHIVRVYDFLISPGYAAISMEYVDGDTLLDIQMTRPHRVFQPEDIRVWLRQIVDALEYAHHTVRIVHRDLKPANIMVNSRNDSKIADFGLARTVAESMTQLTMGPTKFGTLAYMSPQQMYGENPVVADDIYSLGATLFDLFTGRPPYYQGDVYLQVAEKSLPSVARRRKELDVDAPPIPKKWEDLIASCMSKDASQRPKTVREIADRLNLSVASPLPVRITDKTSEVTSRISGDVVYALRKVSRVRNMIFGAALLITLLLALLIAWQEVPKLFTVEKPTSPVLPARVPAVPQAPSMSPAEKALVDYLTGLGTVRPDNLPDSRRALSPTSLSLAEQGDIYIDAREWDRAIGKLEEVLKAHPENGYALCRLGFIRMSQGKYSAAKAHFERAAELEPRDPEPRFGLGQVLQFMGKPSEAIQAYALAAALNPGDARIRYTLGTTCMTHGWRKVAEQELLTSIQIKGNFAEPHRQLALLYSSQTPPNRELARYYYERARSLGVEPVPSLEAAFK